jgi:hypothetical protein
VASYEVEVEVLHNTVQYATIAFIGGEHQMLSTGWWMFSPMALVIVQ